MEMDVVRTFWNYYLGVIRQLDPGQVIFSWKNDSRFALTYPNILSVALDLAAEFHELATFPISVSSKPHCSYEISKLT